MNTEKVWFVTRASKGLGLALVKQLLQAGYKVVATTRSVPALTTELSFGLDQLLPIQDLNKYFSSKILSIEGILTIPSTDERSHSVKNYGIDLKDLSQPPKRTKFEYQF